MNIYHEKKKFFKMKLKNKIHITFYTKVNFAMLEET